MSTKLDTNCENTSISPVRTDPPAGASSVRNQSDSHSDVEGNMKIHAGQVKILSFVMRSKIPEITNSACQESR